MGRRPSDHRGAALLIALVAVALATVIAVALIERGQQTLARTEALQATERSWQYALGMEALAAETLNRARAGELDPAVLDGTWSEPFEVPGGMVQGRLIDQNARFNVNALAHPDAARADFARAAFGRLLEHLGEPEIIADELADWIAGSSMPAPGSAGDDWYTRLDPPYRTAAVPLAHVSELRWLRSVDEEVWEVISGHVTALPDQELAVNVNATSPAVLASLVAELDIEQARRVLADGPFPSRQMLLEHPVMQPLAGPELELNTAIEGRWYVAQSRVVLDGVERDYFRLLGPAGPGYDEFRYFSQGVP